MYPILDTRVEFKEKKKSKKKLFTVFIILLSVGLFAYFDREKFCWALLIIGCIAYNEYGIKFVKKKLDKINKEGHMSTGAMAVFLCLMIHLISIAAFYRMYEEKGKREVEDIKPHHNMVVPTHGINMIYVEGLEEALGEEYYSNLYSIASPGKKEEWTAQVNKCIDDIVGDIKNQGK